MRGIRAKELRKIANGNRMVYKVLKRAYKGATNVKSSVSSR